MVLLAIIAIPAFLFVQPALQHRYDEHPVGLFLPLTAACALFTAWYCRRSRRDGAAFLSWSLFILGSLGSVAWGLFPNLLMATEDPSYSLTIYNSAASSYGLHVGLVWFGLGIASKVALGFTLVFFIVFFNVYQGVKEVSPTVLANARMLGAGRNQLLRHVYLPSATSWVFSSLHTSVGLAFVGAVVGEYLGSARGVGYLILQAEGTFDINTVMAGILVLTAFALVLDGVVGRVEAHLMRWQPRAGETEKL